jgi:hypothetical protein
MGVIDEINAYLESQPEPKRHEMTSLHHSIVALFPDCPLSYLDGKDDEGKVVTNPNIGYGQQKLRYADGSFRDFYQIGMSANTAGISIFIMGLPDKKYLPEKFGRTIGKATVTSYCVKFKKVADIDVEVLLAAIRDGIALTSI